jgi:vitamin B12 transporter
MTKTASAAVCAAGLILGLSAPLVPQEGQDNFSDEEFILMEDAEGLTVVGTPETTQEKKTITREEIDRVQAPDLAALLQETLNLGVTRYGAYGNQADINIRGFDTERIAVLINGVPANSLLGSEFEINQVDLNAVDRIEVIYGGSDSKYNVSGGLGGVINIITVAKQKPGLRFGGSFSNTAALPGTYAKRDGSTGPPQWQDLADAQKAALSAAYGGEMYSFTANIFANRAANHFLYTDYMDKVRRKENNEVWDTGASASLILETPDLSKFIFSTGAYYGDKNIPTSGYAETAGKQRDFSTRQSLMLDMPRAFRDDLAAEASVNHNWEILGYDPPAGVSSLHDIHGFTAINRWSWYALSRFTLKAGGDYRFVIMDSTDLNRRYQHDGGLYLTGEVKPLEKLLVIPSIKAIFNNNGSSPAVAVPKLGFAWFAAENLTLRNNYFRSFKHPDLEDLYWPAGSDVAGNPNLKPEDGWGTDLGAAWRQGMLSMDGAFFTQYTNDSIHWAPGPDSVWRPSNVGAAVFFGIDGRISVDIPLGRGPFNRIIPSLSYQYMRSYLLSYGYDFASQKRIPYMPGHTAGFSLDLPWAAGSRRAGSLLISGHFESTRYADTANTTKLDPHFLLNVNVNQRINDTLGFFGEIRNLLNSRYESFNAYPMPGFTLTAGIRINIDGSGRGSKQSAPEAAE